MTCERCAHRDQSRAGLADPCHPEWLGVCPDCGRELTEIKAWAVDELQAYQHRVGLAQEQPVVRSRRLWSDALPRPRTWRTVYPEVYARRRA